MEAEIVNCRIMSIEDYISQNYPFYHITPLTNLESILTAGLQKAKSKTRDGICVVRTSDEDIINEIVDTQLQEYNETQEQIFALIRLRPKKHNITADVVAADPVSEDNSHLYNYLCMDVIRVDEQDVICRDLKVGRSGNAKILKDIVELNGYRIPSPQTVQLKSIRRKS